MCSINHYIYRALVKLGIELVYIQPAHCALGALQVICSLGQQIVDWNSVYCALGLTYFM